MTGWPDLHWSSSHKRNVAANSPPPRQTFTHLGDHYLALHVSVCNLCMNRSFIIDAVAALRKMHNFLCCSTTYRTLVDKQKQDRIMRILLVPFPMNSDCFPSRLWLIVFSSQGLTSWSRCSWFSTPCQCWEKRTGRTCYRWHLGCCQTCNLLLHLWITHLVSLQKSTAELWKCFTFLVSQVMPSYISHGWKVKKPFCELLPDVDSQGEMMAPMLEEV